jgi:hypothetical protein
VALVLIESARRSSRSLRSFLEERRQSRHGAVRARNESDHENDSMSFHVDGERSCENLEESSLWPLFHVTHTGTGFTYHVEHRHFNDFYNTRPSTVVKYLGTSPSVLQNTFTRQPTSCRAFTNGPNNSSIDARSVSPIVDPFGIPSS